jgi:hypothetical protein
MNILWYLDSFYFHGQGSSNGFSVEKMVGLCNSSLDGASCEAAAPGTLALVWGTGHRWMGFILGDAWRERLGDEL